ncbi:kinase suppressor of Ras 2-like [Notothenia coriiceps]|uniref:Kinase suppressor of Ras 2-like n=1 Tax=Notothenia coriiceps TaxID=8208 RepID=A0A6I9N3Q3_9TELE|nr:PREDICTED: kinase suppressor of Ras 2-like [Notothenia coriiceps]
MAPGIGMIHPQLLSGAKKKTKPLNLKIHSSVGSCENLPTQRSPLLTERSLRSFFFPSFIPSTPPVHAETPSANTLSVPRWSPQIPRRDLGNSIKHRFSTKYWMSQTCIVCGKGMLFGLKCKNCKLKCHNKCTKEAPPCHLLIIQRGGRESLKVFLSQVFIGDAGLTGGDRGEDIAYFSVLVPAYLGHQFLQLSYPVAKC